jgi:hypothetical protein
MKELINDRSYEVMRRVKNGESPAELDDCRYTLYMLRLLNLVNYDIQKPSYTLTFKGEMALAARPCAD